MPPLGVKDAGMCLCVNWNAGYIVLTCKKALVTDPLLFWNILF